VICTFLPAGVVPWSTLFPVASPSRHICVLTVLAALLPLAACGSDPESDETKVGDVVTARAGVDTEGAPKAHLMVPSGRLDVRAGDPVESVPADATRERSAREAPEGGVFVPLTWTYRTDSFEKLLPVFGRAQTIDMTLVSGDGSYPLAAPVAELDGEGAEAFYVAIEGTGKDLELELEYAGETQTLDLVSGKLKAGRAEPLYDLDPAKYSEKLKTCATEDWIDKSPLTQTTFTCTSADTLVLPFVDGEWAPKNTSYVVIGLTSTLTSYAVYSAAGAGATYTPSSSKEKSELDGKRPTTVIDEKGQAGFAAGFLVFTLKGELPKNLDFHRTYELQRSAVLGDVKAPFERTLDIEGRLPLR